MPRPKFQNECSCRTYQTSYDLDSKDIAVVAAEMHCMLPGAHEVTTRKRTWDTDRYVYSIAATTKGRKHHGR